MVYQSSQVYENCTNSVPTVYQSSKTVNNSQKKVKTAKMTIGVPIVTCLPTVYQSSKTVKNSQKTVKTAKMTIGVPIVTGLPRLYGQCRPTNRQKQSKDSQNSLITLSDHETAPVARRVVSRDFQPDSSDREIPQAKRLGQFMTRSVLDRAVV